MQINHTVAVEGEPQDDGDEHWDDRSVCMLLDCYLQNIDKFRDPKIKKKNMWVTISSIVGKGPENCDRKFRNLKQTYLRLLKKKNRSGAVNIRWPYFKTFEEIYTENGEYQPEIQQQIQEGSTEDVAKVLLSINSARPVQTVVQENVEASTSQNDEAKKKLNKRRYNEFRKITLEMRDRQRTVEEKLDRLINIVEESNSIQRERNAMFQQFLEKLNNSQ